MQIGNLGSTFESSWAAYEIAIDAFDKRNMPFALAGGHALACYTGRTRASKDVDFIIVPEDRELAIDTVKSCGFDDYYDRQPYDRNWIFRSCREDTILDLIWAMPNRRASVQADWLTGGPLVRVHNRTLRLIPAEELLWTKLYVLQRDRSDWPDLLNLIYAAGETLDWRHLLDMIGTDSALLASLLVIFAWLRPESARKLPQWLWRELHLPKPGSWATPAPGRENLLDTRDWFPHESPDETVEAQAEVQC